MVLDEDLKHFYYHWFWGLRKNSTQQPVNLWTQVQNWQAADIALARQKQTEITQKIWPIRTLYWLFNLSNYTKNYYQLAAYDLTIEQKKQGNSMSYVNWLKSEATKKVSSFKKKYHETTSAAQNFFRPKEQTTQTKNAQEQSANREEITRRPSETNRDEMQITAWMLPLLNTLGVIAQSGQLITLTEIKKNYQQKALAVHPDKNPSPSAHQDFITLTRAYKQLEAAFNGNQQEMNPALSRNDVWKMCADLHQQYDSDLQFWRGIKQDWVDIRQDWVDIRRGWVDIRQDWVGIRQDCANMTKQFQENIKTLDALEIELGLRAIRIRNLEKVMAERARVSDEQSDNDESELTPDSQQIVSAENQEAHVSRDPLPVVENLEPLTSLFRSSFFNTLTIRGIPENYFSEQRKSSFPLFTSAVLRLLQQTLNHQCVDNPQQEPVLMICDRPAC